MSGRGLIADAGGQLQLHLLRAPGLVDPGLHPLDLGEIDAVVVGEKAAHIDAGGLRPFRNADRAAFQVLRAFDPAVAAHVDGGMAMHPGRKHRDRDHRGVALRGQRDVFAERQFRDVPFERLGKPKGDLLDRGKDQRRQRDAVRAHQALRDLAHVLVVADRQGEMHRRGAVAADDLRPARVRRGGLRRCRARLSLDVACIVMEAPRAQLALLLGAGAVRNDPEPQVPRASNPAASGPRQHDL